MVGATVSALTGIKLTVEGLLRNHRELVGILAIFISLRLSLLVISHPQGYLVGTSDYDFYMDFGRLSDKGLYPDIDYWTEYPPFLPWLSVVIYKLVEPIPNLGSSSIFWFRMALGSVMLPFDVGNLILVYWLANALRDRATAVRTAWVYALLFIPLHVWLAWFDVMPLFFLLVAVALGVSGRRELAALAAGFGFMVKVVPVLALPALLKAEGGLLGKVKLVALSASAALLMATPFLLTGPQYLFASFVSMAARSPWETVWAIYEGYFGYGVVAPLNMRQDPSTAYRAGYDSHLPWVAITAAFAVLYLLLWTRRFDIHSPLHAVAFTGLTVNLFLLYSKGYSPQFLVYVVPFALLVLPYLRAIGYLAVLGAINLLEYPVYGALFPHQHEVLGALVIFRTVLLLMMDWEYLAVLGLLPSMARVRTAAAASGMAAFVVWGAVAVPQAGVQWLQSSLVQRPDRLLVDYLRANAGPGAVVVFTDQGVYRDLYPYLYRDAQLVLLDTGSPSRSASSRSGTSQSPTDWGDVDAQLAQLASQYNVVFTVRQQADRNAQQVERLLSMRDQLQSVRNAQNLVVSRWSSGDSASSGG